jgi:hypothetical protein
MTAAEPVHASIYWVKASKHWALDEVRVIGDTFLTSRIGEYDTWSEARGVFLWRAKEL